MGYIDRKIQKKALKGKSAIICGGSKGIGRETAKLFTKLGADLLIIARGLDALEETKNECLKLVSTERQEIEIAPCDCTDSQKLKPILENHIKKHGSPTFLVNVVGYAYPQYVEKLEFDDFKKNLETNYYGQLAPTIIVLPHMIEAQKGQIAFVSSIVGFMGMMGYATYAPSKFAIVGLAESLRNELNPYNIKISVLYPPDTDTPGLEIENATKPPECAIISEGAKLQSPEKVAELFVKGILKKKFTILKGDVKLYWWVKRFIPRIGFWILDGELTKARKKIGKN